MTMSAANDNRVRARVTVEGLVQGVGFRPFVHRLAHRYDLGGSVHNFLGGVVLEVEGEAPQVEAFLAALPRERPPIARLLRLSVEHLTPTGERTFVILPSRESAGGAILISPDVATCPDCRRELFDPADRRYRYPFTNCTNCGPRFTIVRRVPYDRPHTTMAPFRMCPSCQAEYDHPDDRRYHAQPNACPVCGPQVTLVGNGEEVAGDEAVRRAIELLVGGQIVAIKGLGGFHLACDATSEAAVRRLRERKHREERPLAVMSRSLEKIARYAELTPEAEELLTGPVRPIVLLRKRPGDVLSPSVAPDSRYYGVMTPYTPLHHLLLADERLLAVVMTSGNLSEEPLATDNQEAQKRLGGIADAFLLHNREIQVGCDDSVVRPTAVAPILMRRARGYVPFPVALQRDLGRVLAVGGHLKNTFCLTSGRHAFLSQHIGELDNAETWDYFQWCVRHLQSVLRVEPEVLAHDLHPDYPSTRYALDLARERSLPAEGVQHHHAHASQCMAENGLEGEALAIVCDGTGYGTDGRVWGCELLATRYEAFRRLGHLAYVPLPGGEQAVREPWRMAAVYLDGQGLLEADVPFCRGLDRGRWKLLAEMMARGLNSPLASSAGRLFDAAAALLGLREVNAYEGQAPMLLEATATEAEGIYDWSLGEEAGLLVLDPGPMFGGMVGDLRAGADSGTIAARFQGSFVAMLAQAAVRLAAETGLRRVVLSGGTMQNERVLTGLHATLSGAGLEVFTHAETPPNDAGLALGQAVVAAARRS